MSELKLDAPLRANEIEFRVQSINKGGYATILAYKDARTDIKRLNAVCGKYGWQRKHTRDNRNCIISLWDSENKHWVEKEDTGAESNTEKEKGLASDSFKRAGFNWGIGIELYDYPHISVKLNGGGNQAKGVEWYLNENKKDNWGNPKPSAGYEFKLKEWKWYNEFEDGALTLLTAKDEKGVVRFNYKNVTPFRFKNGEKDEILESVLQALSAGDETAIRSIRGDFDSPESEMAFWALFTSRERSSIKSYLDDNK